MSDTSLGLDENIEGALCYLFGWLTGIIFLVLEKDNRFVKFHAMQSIVVFLVLTVLWMIVGAITMAMMIGASVMGSGIIAGLLSLFSMLISLAMFVLWLFLMYKAYSGEMYKIPKIGDWVESKI
ncbi:MAG: Chloroplast import component protein (Tic20) [Candidatus Syntrophoarchaeum sp. GoM_oil]|nr:MAG: Chloroplast import component protein (Tic20) [Candidatus Syntrophoarchaeum sp. GoM_oil]